MLALTLAFGAGIGIRIGIGICIGVGIDIGAGIGIGIGIDEPMPMPVLDMQQTFNYDVMSDQTTAPPSTRKLHHLKLSSVQLQGCQVVA